MQVTLLFLGDMTGAFTEMLSSFLVVVPKIIFALLVLLVGYIFSRVFAKIVQKGLEKIQIDQLGERLNTIELVEKSSIRIKLSVLFARIIYYILMLFVWVAAADALNMEVVSQLVMDVFNFMPNLLIAFIILILGLLLAETIRKIVLTTCSSLQIPSGKLISALVFYFIFINIIITALSQAKINVDFLSQNISLIIGGAVLAFAIGYGLASRDILANYLAAFYGKDLVREGDEIVIQGTRGKVVAVNRSTITLWSDGMEVIIPFQKAMTSIIKKSN